MIHTELREAVAEGSITTKKRVEIFLDSCSIRGNLETAHSRVSDHLNAGDETVCLRDTRVVRNDGMPMAAESTVVVNTSAILFIVDLSPRLVSQPGSQVERDEREVTLNIGTIWVRGHAHLPVGGEVETFFSGTASCFMPLTEAIVVGYETTAPRTVLINREQLRCVVA